MKRPLLFRLNGISVVEIRGEDASTIVHNLTTQAIRDMKQGETRETFVTDVKGKTVGHLMVQRDLDAIRLAGPLGQSNQVATHIDRYIIREEAQVSILDGQYNGLVANPELATQLLGRNAGAIKADDQVLNGTHPNTTASIKVNGQSIPAITVAWAGRESLLLLTTSVDADIVAQSIADEYQCQVEDEESFHQARTLCGFPWFGVDLNESNLPQEADRDRETISFTKGCYLGQETIARLDAMGQVQKKLVRWKITGGEPCSGSTVESEGKVVGRLTSVAKTEDGVFAIGPARRTHFESGSTAVVVDEVDSNKAGTAEPMIATVQ